MSAMEDEAIWLQNRIARLRHLAGTIGDKQALQVIRELIEEAEVRLRQLSDRRR